MSYEVPVLRITINSQMLDQPILESHTDDITKTGTNIEFNFR